MRPVLAAAGADVIIGGVDYSEALAAAEVLCSQDDLASVFYHPFQLHYILRKNISIHVPAYG
jgi:hypothetical protein